MSLSRETVLKNLKTEKSMEQLQIQTIDFIHSFIFSFIECLEK